MSLVHDHRSMCDQFRWFGAPNDPIHLLAEEQWINVKQFMRWMLRIVDLPGAIVGRGYDETVVGELHLEINDPLIPENHGRWLVRVAEGKAAAERGGDGRLAMDIRALAPLYTSLFTAEQLVSSGVIEAADIDQVGLASRVFAGPPPWMPEIF